MNQPLKYFSYATAMATLILIFIGGLVTSTGSGLSVPDWPLSYGMFFPPMVGGVFYEHGHRMVASGIGLMMVILLIWIMKVEKRRWVKNVAWIGLLMVIFQGLLGGLTVLLKLPTAVSMSHGILAQTFFLLTLLLAYSQTSLRVVHESGPVKQDRLLAKYLIGIIFVIYAQLFVGALMRHTGSGLAIPDFPKMGGLWWPTFTKNWLDKINLMRHEQMLTRVNLFQVGVHLVHRVGAIIVLIIALFVFRRSWTSKLDNTVGVKKWGLMMLGIVLLQAFLGMGVVWGHKQYQLTSLHVALGALTLGVAFLFYLRVSPILIKK